MDEAKNTFFTGGGRRNVTIDMELDLPTVMADRRRIIQVLGNLLSNAARYSPESSSIRVSAGRVLTFDALLDRVWGLGRSGDRGSVRTYVKRLRRKLHEDAGNPKYIFAEPRVGYRMPKGEAKGKLEEP